MPNATSVVIVASAQAVAKVFVIGIIGYASVLCKQNGISARLPYADV
jgi:hypothetical protein